MVKSTNQSALSEGRKYDSGKAPAFSGLFNYFPRALVAVARVSQYGAEKYEIPYEDENWARVDNGSARYRNADGRHTLHETIDGFYDPESGEPHLAHKAWNTMAALELDLRKLEEEQSKGGTSTPLNASEGAVYEGTGK